MAILPFDTSRHLAVGCLLYMHGTLSAETFLAVIVLSFGVMQPLINPLFPYTDDIAQVTIIVGEVAEVLSGEDMQRPERAEKLPADNAVELKDVRFAYHDKGGTARNRSAHCPGTVNALVGPSGSGKSTIARPHRLPVGCEGTEKSTLGGVDIRTLPLAECARSTSPMCRRTTTSLTYFCYGTISAWAERVRPMRRSLTPRRNAAATSS